MTRQHNFKLAYRSLKASRGRNFLTMLGIIIGVTAVVLMVCIGAGIRKQALGQLGRYGRDTFIVQPAQNSSAGPLASIGGAGSSLLTEKDLNMVQKDSTVATAVPLAVANGSMRADHTVDAPFIVATTADFATIVKQKIAYGGFFDSDEGSHTVTLGSAIAHRLFNDNAPLGETLTWRGQQFVVAGVFDDFASAPFSLEANFNNAVFMPYSTAQSLSSNTLGIYQILATVTGGQSTSRVVQHINAELVRAHGGAHDVSVQPAGKLTSQSNQTVHLLTLTITIAALVALVVGGVGIMDVMLVSVTERMHEIGLRKAIGATNRQIMRQFMAEAFILSAVGALIALAIAAATVGLMRLYSSLQPVLVWQAFVLAPLVAITVGLVFGSLPALKAARKDPIEALRHE